MSKFYTVSLQNETIIFTAAFEKKLNNGNKEAYDLYVETKAKFPMFKIEVEEAKKRVGKYDIRLWTILKPTLVTMNTKNGRSSLTSCSVRRFPARPTQLRASAR